MVCELLWTCRLPYPRHSGWISMSRVVSKVFSTAGAWQQVPWFGNHSRPCRTVIPPLSLVLHFRNLSLVGQDEPVVHQINLPPVAKGHNFVQMRYRKGWQGAVCWIKPQRSRKKPWFFSKHWLPQGPHLCKHQFRECQCAHMGLL